MKTYTITVTAEEAKEEGLDGQIVVCNDCGEFAHSEETVVHHATCKDGESERFGEIVEETNAMEIAMEEEENREHGRETEDYNYGR